MPLGTSFQFGSCLTCPVPAFYPAPFRLIGRVSQRSPQVRARRRSTRRLSDDVNPPSVPFTKPTRSNWRQSGRQERKPSPGEPGAKRFGNAYRQKEPFDAELVVLFGLPTLIILIPWVISDPAALAIVPLVLLIPGPRDILLTVVRDLFTGARRASNFMRDGQSARRRQGRQSPSPPPGSQGKTERPLVYDLLDDEFEFVVERSKEDDGAIQSDQEPRYNYPTQTRTQNRSNSYDGWRTNEKIRSVDTKIERSMQDILVIEAEPKTDASSRCTRPSRQGGRRRLDAAEDNNKGRDKKYRNLKSTRVHRGDIMLNRQSSSGPGQKLGRRHWQRMSEEKISWYARPFVVLFPFLKYWGGFM